MANLKTLAMIEARKWMLATIKGKGGKLSYYSNQQITECAEILVKNYPGFLWLAAERAIGGPTND